MFRVCSIDAATPLAVLFVDDVAFVPLPYLARMSSALCLPTGLDVEAAPPPEDVRNSSLLFASSYDDAADAFGDFVFAAGFALVAAAAAAAVADHGFFVFLRRLCLSQRCLSYAGCCMQPSQFPITSPC